VATAPSTALEGAELTIAVEPETVTTIASMITVSSSCYTHYRLHGNLVVCTMVMSARLCDRLGTHIRSRRKLTHQQPQEPTTSHQNQPQTMVSNAEDSRRKQIRFPRDCEPVNWNATNRVASATKLVRMMQRCVDNWEHWQKDDNMGYATLLHDAAFATEATNVRDFTANERQMPVPISDERRITLGDAITHMKTNLSRENSRIPDEVGCSKACSCAPRAVRKHLQHNWNNVHSSRPPLHRRQEETVRNNGTCFQECEW
jgi:hypothetical protein